MFNIFYWMMFQQFVGYISTFVNKYFLSQLVALLVAPSERKDIWLVKKQAV